MQHLGLRLGGSERSKALIQGKGIGLILKSIKVNFRRPVLYPDTVSTRSPFNHPHQRSPLAPDRTQS